MIAKRKRKTTPHKKTTVGDVKSTPTCSSSCDNSRIQIEETGDSSEGCRKCGLDNDHSHLLLCESCNDEYHTYCLDPPLQYVPEGDFFCDKCKPLISFNRNDTLDEQVAALPPLFTTRFGEIIWAAGGVGFGWWPACIYDPRLTVGGARKLALKHVGKKHLVYFFGCSDAPFTVLTNVKCMPWEMGMMEDFDSGKTAKAMGKTRSLMFEWALQAAIAENEKPIDCRLDWNHESELDLSVVAFPGKPARNSTGSASGKRSSPANKNNSAKKTKQHESEKKLVVAASELDLSVVAFPGKPARNSTGSASGKRSSPANKNNSAKQTKQHESEKKLVIDESELDLSVVAVTGKPARNSTGSASGKRSSPANKNNSAKQTKQHESEKKLIVASTAMNTDKYPEIIEKVKSTSRSPTGSSNSSVPTRRSNRERKPSKSFDLPETENSKINKGLIRNTAAKLSAQKNSRVSAEILIRNTTSKLSAKKNSPASTEIPIDKQIVSSTDGTDPRRSNGGQKLDLPHQPNFHGRHKPSWKLMSNEYIPDSKQIKELERNLVSFSTSQKSNQTSSEASNKNQNASSKNGKDSVLFCKVCRNDDVLNPSFDDCDVITSSSVVGFITLSSTQSTFADARTKLNIDLDEDCLPSKWRFYVPNLGPMSMKQESLFGPMLKFVELVTKMEQFGDGTSRNPLRLIIYSYK